MRILRIPRWDRAVIGCLVLLLIGQGAALIHKERQPPPFVITSLGPNSVSFVSNGMLLDGLRTQMGPDQTGILPIARTPGQATVLMAFSETCAHAGEVSPLWAGWMAERVGDARLTLIPVSGDAPENAARFASSAGWTVTPTTLQITELGSPEIQVLNRTPWVFLLDTEGRVVYEGHGAELDRLDQAIEAYLSGAGHPDTGTAIAQTPSTFDVGG